MAVVNLFPRRTDLGINKMYSSCALFLRILMGTKKGILLSRNVSGKNNTIEVQPKKRTLQVLTNDLLKKSTVSPSHCDILVIGGGIVGSSVAYWLKRRAREGLNVVVVEKDFSYTESSTVLSVGGLRQQFSLIENIEMSLFGAEFIRNVRNYFCRVDLKFNPHGYLTLSTEDGSETMRRNSRLQNELGARNELLTAERLNKKFPWINSHGIALGCHGLEKEGWFDPWVLLTGLKTQSMQYGAHFMAGELIDFEFRKESNVHIEDMCQMGLFSSLDKAVIRTQDGKIKTIKFAICVIAAGSNSGKVASLANIGTGKGILSIGLPVEPRKRYVYVINSGANNIPALGTPLTIDPNGTYFRCDTLSGNYICGRSPSSESEPKVDSLNVDIKYFETNVWPSLANRVKGFESVKICSSWAGFYDYNMYDENGIIGQHPYYKNLYIAAGFSGHGIQQAPAVGRAISELIIDGQFRTIDLTRLGFDRLITQKPMLERIII